jgi:Protein of unknown function (DUF2905)
MAIENIGKALITLGIVLIVIGSLFFVMGKIPWFGRLPGDIMIKNDNVTFFFPITTMILLSIVVTLIFNIIGRR